jgi:hypothetical protein
MSQLIDLYSLLPAIYKQQDQQENLSLQALFSVMQQEFDNIQGQIDTSYNNCFIETCETWAEAYIASLLGIQGLDSNNILATQRARIANTIRYRRRKGQQSVLERIISDVTGWRTSILEYVQLLGATQCLQHIRSNKGQTMNIRNIDSVSTLTTPFEANAHRIDVRSYPAYPAKFNINNIGLFIWRLVSYPITGAMAYAVTGVINGYTFNPIGLDMQLFNASQSLTDLTQTATESSLPVAIRPTAFAQDLAANADSGTCVYYGNSNTINQITITVVNKGQKSSDASPVPATNIIAADLSNWQTMQPTLLKDQIAIDVNLGRFILGDGYTDIDHISVHYNYGFSAPMGGGHYDRGATLAAADENTIYVPAAPANSPNASAATLSEAIALWQSDSKYTTIQIEDDGSYFIETDLIINNSKHAGASRYCTIQAANNTRPCLQLAATAAIQLDGHYDDANPLIVNFNGLLINGTIDLQNADTQSVLIDLQQNVELTIEHCTLAPQFAEPAPDNELTQRKNVISISSTENSMNLQINNSISGALCLPEHINLTVNDSIIDDQDNGVALAAGQITDSGGIVDTGPGATTSMQRTTVFGKIHVAEVSLLSESIVTGTVISDRAQDGVVRFSYLPMDSRTPPRYLCQPDTDLNSMQQSNSNFLDNNSSALQPQFTSTRYNDPGYAQLNINVPQSIATGAANGSEMGCFQSLNQPQYQAQLQALLDEYLPLGLITSLFYVS